MSAKEKILEFVKSLPEGMSWDEIVKDLQQRSSMQSAGEGDDVEFEWPQDDITDEEWRLFVAQSLRDELNDPEEDIYSLDDGVPPDGPR